MREKMIKRLINKLKSLFKPKELPKIEKPERSKPKIKLGDKVGNVTISKQYQLDKRTDFKPGESYRVGEMIVTVHASKADMLKAIAIVDARRTAKEKRLRGRAIDIMLMTPEELEQLKIEEYLSKRLAVDKKVKRIVGESSTRLIEPNELPQDGRLFERFKKIMKELKEKVY